MFRFPNLGYVSVVIVLTITVAAECAVLLTTGIADDGDLESSFNPTIVGDCLGSNASETSAFFAFDPVTFELQFPEDNTAISLARYTHPSIIAAFRCNISVTACTRSKSDFYRVVFVDTWTGFSAVFDVDINNTDEMVRLSTVDSFHQITFEEHYSHESRIQAISILPDVRSVVAIDGSFNAWACELPVLKHTHTSWYLLESNLVPMLLRPGELCRYLGPDPLSFVCVTPTGLAVVHAQHRELSPVERYLWGL